MSIDILFLDEVRKIVKLSESPQANRSDFLVRDILLMIWFECISNGSNHPGKYRMIPKQRIYDKVGAVPQTISAIERTISQNGVLQPYITSVQDDQGQPAFKISTDLLSKLTKAIQETYMLPGTIPGMPEYCTTNWILEQIYREHQDTSLKVAMIASAIKSIVRDVKVTPGNAGFIYLQPRNSNADWIFTLHLVTQPTALTKADMVAIHANITEVVGDAVDTMDIQDQHMNILLIAPPPADQETLRYAVHATNIYHLWPLAFIRFLHLLQEFVNGHAAQHDAIVANFNRIFPTQPSARISASAMIQRIKESL